MTTMRLAGLLFFRMLNLCDVLLTTSRSASRWDLPALQPATLLPFDSTLFLPLSFLPSGA